MARRKRIVKTLLVLFGASCLVMGRWLEGEPEPRASEPVPELAPQSGPNEPEDTIRRQS